ncbi:MAG TPA: hypothetical protein VH482_13025 [Thermomicrobiales bacterium]|jgi:hypothetical protein
MGRSRVHPSNVGTPETREAVRTQIVQHGHTSSRTIAAELDLPHPTVVRVLQRFAAIGALAVEGPIEMDGPVEVVPGSLSARFRNLSAPLW